MIYVGYIAKNAHQGSWQSSLAIVFVVSSELVNTSTYLNIDKGFAIVVTSASNYDAIFQLVVMRHVQ